MLDIVWRYFRRTFAVSLLNVFSLWSIKASFPAFFYNSGNQDKGHRTIWWTATVAWFVGLAISVGVQNYKCNIGTREEAIAFCSTKSYGEFIYSSLRVQAACDVITDAFIMAIPIKILWHAQISARSKIGLMVLFSLILFTMIIAIIRLTLSLRNKREDDSWIYVWAAIEAAVGIIVASAISYRALGSRERKQSAYTGHTEHRNNLRYEASSQGNASAAAHAGKPTSSSKSSLGGKEEAVPLDAIRVKSDYDVVPAGVGPRI
ncbi:MAG: hypothetical protein L6R35_005656 [Caloplaca aegaea]|nr:MAG: hypothetical protein L6R35_005656 [Caloplaca aegaea]